MNPFSFIDELTKLKDTQIPIILAGAGILFLFIAVGGQLGAKVTTDKVKRGLAGIIGIIFLGASLGLYVFTPPPKNPTPTEPPVVIAATQSPTTSFITPSTNSPIPTQPTNAPTSANLPIPMGPQISNIRFCDRDCSKPGAIQLSNLPEGSNEIFWAFDYSGMRPGMSYMRIWTSRGEEWVRYNCIWNGSENGTFYGRPLYDFNNGLRSGVWEIIIKLEDQDAVNGSVTVAGVNNRWSPNGVLKCTD